MLNLTEKLGNIWEEIEKQPKDIWFFYLFLLTFTLGIRKVILYFPLKGAFNEYTGAYVYASDIFLCLTILVWIVSILYNKIVNMSMSSDGASRLIHKIDHVESVDNSPTKNLSTGKFAYFKSFLAKLFHVEQFKGNVNVNCSTWNNFYCSGILLIPLLLVFWSFISSFWSENQIIGIYRSIKLFELYFLYIYTAIRFVPYCLLSLNNCSTWNILSADSSENVPPSYAEASAGKRGTFSDKCGKLFHVEQSGYFLSKMAQYFRAILLGLLVIALFDHYLWDIWQSQVLFWLVCEILAGVSFGDLSNIKKCSTLLRQDSGGQAWNKLEENEGVDVSRLPAGASAQAGGTICTACVFFGIIIFLGVTHSLIGIAQFIIQHSLGLFWLRESLIGQNIPGVAKIIANHHVLIRSYGLFPHPNILGGFLFFSIMVTILYKKMFHLEESKIVPRGTISDHGAGVEQFDEKRNVKCSTNLRQGSGWQAWNNFWQVWKNVPRGTFWSSLIKFGLVIQIIGIILSFSKSAILALAVALVYINVPRGTILGKYGKLFHVEQFRILLGLGLVVLGGLFFLRVEFYALFMKSLAERGLYLSISERIIAENPIVGVGTGQFIFESVRLFPSLEIWQYQPVHNVFLLIWSEWGIVGLVLFILFLWKLFHLEESKIVPRGTIRNK